MYMASEGAFHQAVGAEHRHRDRAGRDHDARQEADEETGRHERERTDLELARGEPAAARDHQQEE
jgi:hypothetical protein